MSFPSGISAVRQRLFAKVRKTSTCWEWVGLKGRRGYGTMRAFQRKRWQAHRLSWFLHHGPIPEGQWVLHRCDNPSCVNPAHLFLGTHLDNVKDKVAKNRQCKGAGTNNNKLTESEVRLILAHLQSGASYGKLSSLFKVTKRTIGDINTLHTWKHVHR